MNEDCLKPAFIYKVTNLVNGKYYIGVRTLQFHKGDDLYLGSGIGIVRAVKEYGCENFKREILFEGSKSDCFELEELIVDEDFVKDEMTYNQRCGGRLHDGEYGVRNVSFKGYWVTPFGVFVSSTSCAKYFGISKITVQKRCKERNYPGWRFSPVGDNEFDFRENQILPNPLHPDCYVYTNKNLFTSENQPKISSDKLSLSQKTRRIEIDGVAYRGIKPAARILGVSSQFLRHRLISSNYETYKYLE